MPQSGDIGDGAEHERRFELFGSHVRLLIGEPVREGLPSPEAMAMQLEGLLRVIHKRLSRFDPQSELCALNADPAESRAVSPILATAVEAALWSAERSAGLIDPVVVDDLERAGYESSKAHEAAAPIELALASAPMRRAARARDDAAWKRISVDRDAGFVQRPPGTRIDSGGTGKGLAADLASSRLDGYATHVVDAGGDLRIGGEQPLEREVRIEHPLDEQLAHRFSLDQGAVATSGIKTRLWPTENGFAHHLLDPSTGKPAWTGVIQATALGRTALEAETLAKIAFLSGPDEAERVLSELGGLVVLDDGSVEVFGELNRSGAPEDRVAA
jgi:thiamine biosynthesis lipoprotein